MPSVPSLVIFDVNETLSDLTPLDEAFAAIGLPGQARLWFASVLRDGIALAAAGAIAPFATVAAEQLRALMAGTATGTAPEAAVERVVGAFSALDVHPDVGAGVGALRAAGLRLATLSNGSATVAHQLLGRAGLRHQLEAVLSVEDVGVWKPAPAAYRYACDVCAVAPGDAVLVAVHPWDLDGAARAGLRTAWVDRRGGHYPSYARRPDLVVTDLAELAAALTR